MQQTLLITGGAGFIGSNLIAYILENTRDISIVNLDSLTYAGNLYNVAGIAGDKRYTFVHGSITDSDCVANIFQKYSCTGIINCAAESHVDRSINSARPFVDTNIFGTLVLLEAAKQYGVTRYLQMSTDEVYGSLGDDGYFTEDSVIAPNSPYSASKASADCLVRSFVHTHNLDAVITRCSNNYGPFQFPEKLIPLMISQAMQNKPLPVYGDGLNVRDWIHVRDHCAGVWQAFCHAKMGSVYNFGGESERTNLEVVRAILNGTNNNLSLITFVQDRPGHDRRYAIDCAKAKHEIGWQPMISFEDGLAQTIKWYAENSDWIENIQSGQYREYNKRSLNLSF